MLFIRSIVGLCLLAASCCFAQQQQEPAPDGGASGMTLHVTVKELQVAALVLDAHRKPVTEIDKSRFRLQVDNDKPFSPTTVHRAGDDPISLAVVMDMSREHRYQQGLAEALAILRERALLPHDHLLLFAVDCNLIFYRGDTGTPEQVQRGVDQILANPQLHYAGNRNRHCEDRLHLWDAANLALERLRTMPGRHALLLVTDGRDGGSITPMLDLARRCTITATTLIALPSTDLQSPNGPRSAIETLAIRTGGQLLDSPSKNDLERSFTDCMALLRERYILGFNQPQHAKVGDHVIQTLVQRGRYVVRTSGVSVPISDKEEVTQTLGQDPSSDEAAKP